MIPEIVARYRKYIVIEHTFCVQRVQPIFHAYTGNKAPGTSAVLEEEVFDGSRHVGDDKVPGDVRIAPDGHIVSFDAQMAQAIHV